MARFRIGSVTTEVVGDKLVIENNPFNTVLLRVGDDTLPDSNLALLSLTPGQLLPLPIEDVESFRVVVLRPKDVVAEALQLQMPLAIIEALEQYEHVLPPAIQEEARGVILVV